MPLLHIYKWVLSVEAAESHSHHIEQDTAASDIIKISPKDMGSVTHKRKQMFFM